MAKRALVFGLFLTTLSIAPVQSAHALSILVDGTGYDPGYVTDFWGVEFLEGPGYIETVTFNMPSAVYFDYDGSAFLDPSVPGVEPIIGDMGGLTLADIAYPTDNGNPIGHPDTLTFSFAPGAFSEGDWFRFSGDVDGPSPFMGGGESLEFLGATVLVSMSNGESYEAPFIAASNDSSEARIDVASIPDPSTMLLLGSACLVGLAGARRP